MKLILSDLYEWRNFLETAIRRVNQTEDTSKVERDPTKIVREIINKDFEVNGFFFLGNEANGFIINIILP